MKEKIGVRIKELREFLKLTQTEFSQKIGVKQANLSHMESSGSKISVDILQKIISNFNISSDWLLTGESEMLRNQIVQNNSDTHTSEPSKTAQNQHKDTQNIAHTNQNRHLIPLYSDISSIGGNNELSANMDGVSQPVEYIDTGDWFRGATAAIRHYGDSMIEYPPGCVLALKEVYERQLIIWGENYVIETNEYRITKRIQRGKNEEYIKACSSNMEIYPDGALIHEPIDIAWKDIHKIFLVLGHVIKKNGGTMVFNVKK